jgi:4-hydroxy-tetrahydrodipicolinate synthase
MELLSSTRLSGIWLPLITPFIDGAVDEGSLARLVAHYLPQNIDGLIVAATTGEGLVLDDAETAQVVAITANAVARQIPLFLGLCGSDTRRLVRRLTATDAWPVDGYLITCP